MSPVRPLRASDAEALVTLSAQLGYPSTKAELETRLTALLHSERDAVLGITLGDGDQPVVGWVHVEARLLLEKNASAEVCSLVVSDLHRGKGLGKRLMAAAEDWARARGFGEALRTNVVRTETHAFYKNLGYAQVKTSYQLRKALS